VLKREWLYQMADSSCLLPAAIVTYQLCCKNLLKLFDGGLPPWVLLPEQDEGIGDRNENQEVGNVFIKFPDFQLIHIVAPQLITSVHPSHMFVVGENCSRAGNGHSGPILLLAEDATLFQGTETGGHHSHHLAVHPR